MDDHEMLAYLKELDKKYSKKDMNYFWVMCDNETFKPMKNYSDKEIQNKFMKNPTKYAGRSVAHITIYIKYRIGALIDNDSLIHVIITIFKIQQDGKINYSSGVKTLMVLYFKDDLEKKKFKTKDVERFMRLCYDGVLRSEVLNGKPFKVLMKELKKKKIKFSDV
jgi:hypothetical protein